MSSSEMEKGIDCDADEQHGCLRDEAQSSSTLSSTPSSTTCQPHYQKASCCHQRRRADRWLHGVHVLVTVGLVIGLATLYCQHQRDMASLLQQCSIPAAASSSSSSSSSQPASPAVPAAAAQHMDDPALDYQDDITSDENKRDRRAQSNRKDRPDPLTPRQVKMVQRLIRQELKSKHTVSDVQPDTSPASPLQGRTLHLVMRENRNKANSAGIFDNFHVQTTTSWNSWQRFYKESDGRLEVPENGLYVVFGQMTYSDNKSVDTLVIERQPFDSKEATQDVVTCSSVINPLHEQGTKLVTCTMFTVARLYHRDRLQFIDNYAKSKDFQSPRSFRTDHADSFWGIIWMAA